LIPAKIWPAFIFLFSGIACFSQTKDDSALKKIDPVKWRVSIEKKATRLQERILSKSNKTLIRLQRQEEKIYKRLLKGRDSLKAKAELADVKKKYQSLRERIVNPNVQSENLQYISKLDTLTTSLKFLQQYGIGEKLNGALAKTKSLQNQFQQAEEIRKFIRERKQQLREQLERIGFAKQLKKFNKDAYYYSVQLNEYKEILNDSKKAERKSIELLSKTKLFQNFFRKNSMLASLFRMPGEDINDPAVQASMAGLQTRAQVNNLIQQQIAAGGPNAVSQFRERLLDAQGQLNSIKSKINQMGVGGSDMEMPEGFKPNNQKTKSFWKRLEIGTNAQSQRSTNFFPVTSDLGLSLGYKLNNKSVIGIGAAYKLGWGHGWNRVKLTSEGAGLRSFVDWKLRGSFWITGGFETNYKTAFSKIDQLKNFSSWQQSSLLGVSKVINIKSKYFSKTKLQLLWDFLSYQQMPRTQPIIFRIGYNIK
jgi:hypothetical protein